MYIHYIYIYVYIYIYMYIYIYILYIYILYIYMYIQLRMVPQKTVAGEAQRFSGIWLAAIQTDTALQYLAQLYSLFSLDKNDYDGSRFCLHEYKWFHLHPLVPLVISSSSNTTRDKQTKHQPTHTTAHSTELFLVSLLVCCCCCSSASSPCCFLFRKDLICSSLTSLHL